MLRELIISYRDVLPETAYPILIGVVMMREFPKGGMIGKTVHLLRAVQSLQVPLYAANACYFIVLAVFPALLLLLSLLRYTTLEVEGLGEMLYGVFPEALAVGAEELVLLTYDNTSGTILGLSAVTALWSASRGMYGVLTGLTAIYGIQEERGYVHIRLLSALYMVAFLMLLILTLGLHVFSAGLAALLEDSVHPVLLFLGRVINFRFWVLLVLQTGFFAVMFKVLPGGTLRFAEGLPGALLAAFGWQIFSDLYSVYVEHFAHLSSIYGSVYAVALSMLWLYCCMSIVFYGGALNVLLKRKNMSQP